MDVWFKNKQREQPKILQNFDFIDNEEEINVTYKANNYWSISKTSFEGESINIPMLLLKFAFKQITGSYIDNVFMSKQFISADKLV